MRYSNIGSGHDLAKAPLQIRREFLAAVIGTEFFVCARNPLYINRNTEIIRDFVSGMSLAATGRKHDLSTERIRGLVWHAIKRSYRRCYDAGFEPRYTDDNNSVAA